MPTQGSRFTFACPSIVSQPAKGTVGQLPGWLPNLAESGGPSSRGSTLPTEPALPRIAGNPRYRRQSRPASVAPSAGARPTMLAVSRRAWASRSPASARASCRVRSAPPAAWVSFSASVRALATFCSASWLAVSTALKAFTALRGRLDCTSTRTTWMPSPLPAAANAARLCWRPAPGRRAGSSRRSAIMRCRRCRATPGAPPGWCPGRARRRPASALRATSRSSAGSTRAP